MAKRVFLLTGISQKGKEKQSLIQAMESATVEEIAFALSMAAMEMIKTDQAKFFSINNWEDEKTIIPGYSKEELLSLEHLVFVYLSKMVADGFVL